MKVAVNLYVARTGRPQIRKTRRLAYMAIVAKRAGHSVVIQDTNGVKSYPFLSHIADLPGAGPGDCGADLYLCDHCQNEMTRQRCPVVAFKSRLQLRDDRHLAKRAALIVSYTYREEDWWRNPNPTGARAWDNQIVSVPWLPHEVMLEYLDAHGLTEAYLDDDLETIRNLHRSPDGKTRLIGFRGQKQNHRADISKRCGAGYIFEWAAGHFPQDEITPQIDAPERLDFRGKQLSPGDYLRWLDSCRASLNLPGDTWKCSRHSESVLMGVPLVCMRGKIPLSEPLTTHNCIMVDDFADGNFIRHALDTRGDAIVASADVSYLRGWSLKGQFSHFLQRLGLT